MFNKGAHTNQPLVVSSDIEMKFNNAYQRLESEGFRHIFTLGGVDVFKGGKDDNYAICDRQNLKLHRGAGSDILYNVLSWDDYKFKIKDLKHVRIGQQLASDLSDEGMYSNVAYVHPFRDNEIMVKLWNEWAILTQTGQALTFNTKREALKLFNSLNYHYWWATNHRESLRSNWFKDQMISIDDLVNFKAQRLASIG